MFLDSQSVAWGWSKTSSLAVQVVTRLTGPHMAPHTGPHRGTRPCPPLTMQSLDVVGSAWAGRGGVAARAGDLGQKRRWRGGARGGCGGGGASDTATRVRRLHIAAGKIGSIWGVHRAATPGRRRPAMARAEPGAAEMERSAASPARPGRLNWPSVGRRGAERHQGRGAAALCSRPTEPYPGRIQERPVLQ